METQKVERNTTSPRVAFRGRFQRAATLPPQFPIPHQHHTGIAKRNKAPGCWHPLIPSTVWYEADGEETSGRVILFSPYPREMLCRRDSLCWHTKKCPPRCFPALLSFSAFSAGCISAYLHVDSSFPASDGQHQGIPPGLSLHSVGSCAAKEGFLQHEPILTFSDFLKL